MTDGAAVQQTLAGTASLAGVGLHCGTEVRVQLLPAAEQSGIVFVRNDLPGQPEIAAAPASVNAAALTRRTELRNADGASVATIEHLLAAAAGLGIDNLRVELDGPEVPILDGSAAPFVAALQSAGLATQRAPRRPLRLKEPVVFASGNAEIVALPAEKPQYTFFADLSRVGMANQAATWFGDGPSFAAEVAPARTFVFYEDLEQLRAAGLIRGGSLDCAIVLKDGAPHQTEYRLPNELASHKLLDLIGDLALLGRPLAAFITARATGHALHFQFIQKLLEVLHDG